MATQTQMDQLLGRALFDNDFRKNLLVDPEKAALSLDCQLDAAQAARIRSLDPVALEQVAVNFQKTAGLDKPHRQISFW